MHQVPSSPKISSRNISLVLESLCHSLIMTLFIGFSQSSVNWTSSVSSSRQAPSSISPVSPWPLAHCSLLLILAPLSPLAGCARRCRAIPSAPTSSAAAAAFRFGPQWSSARFVRASTAQATPSLRVAISSSVSKAASSTWPGNADRALCRRWAPVSRSVAFRQIPSIQAESNRA